MAKQEMKIVYLIQIVAYLIMAYGPTDATGFQIKFTNLECTTLNETVTTFEECALKPTISGLMGLNVHAKVFQVLPDIKVDASFYKKANGYKPFLFNTSVDFCEVMAKKTQNIVSHIIFNIVKDYSNLNHTCPYDHDIHVENLVLSEEKMKFLPLPSGEYLVSLFIGTRTGRVSGIKVYFTRKN
ncbi:uncharacterized protein [Musca autumnalis]|uniref:uncharacterized protein n=1 Tax=Musca autumnalis TaxID=221902 RepID=UPI003CEB507D